MFPYIYMFVVMKVYTFLVENKIGFIICITI